MLAADAEASFRQPSLSRFVGQVHRAFKVSWLSRTSCASKSSASLTNASSPSSAAKAAFMIRAVRCAEKSSSRDDTVGSVSYVLCPQTKCDVGIFHSSLLSIDITEMALTFSSSFCPLRGLSQKFHPLSLVTHHVGISQPSAATCKKQEEARRKIRYSALESLDGTNR